MNLLGHEIDIDFVYRIGPIQSETSRQDAYWIFFELAFKDGRSHKVEIENNFLLESYRGGHLVMNARDLNKTEVKKLYRQKQKDLKVIKDLREKVIKDKETTAHRLTLL